MKWYVFNLQLSTVMFYDTSSTWQQDGSAKTFKEARVARILVMSSKNIYGGTQREILRKRPKNNNKA